MWINLFLKVQQSLSGSIEHELHPSTSTTPPKSLCGSVDMSNEQLLNATNVSSQMPVSNLSINIEQKSNGNLLSQSTSVSNFFFLN